MRKKKSVQPIIVGFAFDEDFSDFLSANFSLYSKESLKPNIPHLTLWMGFIEQISLRLIAKDFYKVFKNISLDVSVSSAERFNGLFGEEYSYSIQKVRMLELLQNRVHHFFEPYRIQVEDYPEFNKSTVSYINDFNKKSLDNFDPHITLGKAGVDVHSIGESLLKVENPLIFIAGNNCTCTEIVQ